MSERFNELERFINAEMRMSHVYQPAMLLTLMLRGGTASKTEIAKALLAYDKSQIEYYEDIVAKMPGRVLTNNRGITERVGQDYNLKGFDQLSHDEVELLKVSCSTRIEEFIDQRGDRPWHHRRRSANPVSGTVRYEVLKNAKHRCELCGTSADVKAIEVDHIKPRIRGGSNDISNLQALCYSCNAMKRDRDDTDFRNVEATYKYRDTNCAYCEVHESLIKSQNNLCFSVQDNDPQTRTHTLVIPRRHTSSYFDLYRPEINALNSLMSDASERVSNKFDIHVSSESTSEPSTSHCYVRLIPRQI
jgi:5-methylcytosine-specific restriction endonuclease McrA